MTTKKKTSPKRVSARKKAAGPAASVKQMRGSKSKVKKVMREFKEGELHSRSKKGPIVKSRKQAIAIALSEAGISKNTKKKASKKLSRKSSR